MASDTSPTREMNAMASPEEVAKGAPFWSPGVDFALYAAHPEWKRRVAGVQQTLACELWQAWAVLLLLTQANAYAYQVIFDAERPREPWEDPEDDDE